VVIPKLFMHKSYYDTDYKMSNREKVLNPKRGNTYCGGCDRALVPAGAKCHICGWHEGRKRYKV
jgi:hypothetical protein